MGRAESVADDRVVRSSDMTLEATIMRRPVAPSFLVSSEADTLLTSGATHFGNFTCKIIKIFKDLSFFI